MAISHVFLAPVVMFVLDHPGPSLILTPLLIFLLRFLYRASIFHPLHKIPGPFYTRISSTWLNYHAYKGTECSAVHSLHQKYGPVVRTAPNSVDIADGSALHPIYVERGGFLKPAFYGNFDIDGHKSIFSEVEPKRRAERAKAVTNLFSTGSLRDGSHAIEQAVNSFVERIQRETAKAKSNHATGATVDLLAICRALAIDVVTAYLFGEEYGGSGEDIASYDKGKAGAKEASPMTASAMVDSFVAVGKFWYLPPRVFQLVERINSTIWPDEQTDQSINQVDSFVNAVVDRAHEDKSSNSYPARLLTAGFSVSEVRAQCKDLIFAGTDSTAMNLATICFQLCKHPSTYQRLQKEIQTTDPSYDELQTLPYLRGVIKEGLRLSMANPSRLPRVVPPQGWTFNNTSTFFPPGTIISCTPYELHFNASIFPDPHAFKPERWLNPTDDMSRDHIPFGLGSRQCIARNLATTELFCAIKRVVEEGLLSGFEVVSERIEIVEWFNSHVVGGKIEVSVRGED